MAKWYMVSFGGDENVLNWIVVMVAQLCDYTKKLWIVLFERVNFMVYELYISKAIITKKQIPVKNH